MNNIKIKIFKSSLVNSIMLAILGALLIFQSEATIISISYIIGAIIIAFGTAAIIKFIKEQKEDKKNELDIAYGIICIVLGIIVIHNPHAIASIIPLVVGIVIILSSATKLQYSMELKNNNSDHWKSTMIISLLTTICGIVLIFNPFSGAVLITRVVGILILIYAILDIISTLTIRSTVEEIHGIIEDNTSDAEVINEETIPEKKKKKKNSKKKKGEKNE